MVNHPTQLGTIVITFFNKRGTQQWYYQLKLSWHIFHNFPPEKRNKTKPRLKGLHLKTIYLFTIKKTLLKISFQKCINALLFVTKSNLPFVLQSGIQNLTSGLILLCYMQIVIRSRSDLMGISAVTLFRWHIFPPNYFFNISSCM